MKLDKLTTIKIGLGLAIVGITAYTITYLFKQVRALVNLNFEWKKTEVNKVTFTDVSMTMWWEVINPSDITFTIKEQKYDVYLNGKFLKSVGSKIPVEILAKGTTMIPTFINFTPKEAVLVGLENLGGLATEDGRRNLKIGIKGNMSVSTPLFYVRQIPIEYSDSLHNMMNY